jgi:enterochelin esterase-like enzyme
METEKRTGVIVESTEILSDFLKRAVKVDFYLPLHIKQPEEMSLLLINDGQDLVTMSFDKLLDDLHRQQLIKPLLCVGIHCGDDRKNEYGMTASVDYKGRGAKAQQYNQFIFEELLPHIYGLYALQSLKEKAFAGFSLGGLSALDIVWNNPEVFQKAGVFSGSLWWRIKDRAEKDFNESHDRLMHWQIRKGQHYPGLKFFFQCGEHDELEDRNRNGVIDSIDDTIDVMRELLAKGYLEGRDMQYLQLPDGKHDVASWARSIPAFLQWGWGRESMTSEFGVRSSELRDEERR